MSLFFLAFLLIYSGMHLLVWWGVRPLLPASPRLNLLFLGWGVLMRLLSPPEITLIELVAATAN